MIEASPETVAMVQDNLDKSDEMTREFWQRCRNELPSGLRGVPGIAVCSEAILQSKGCTLRKVHEELGAFMLASAGNDALHGGACESHGRIFGREIEPSDDKAPLFALDGLDSNIEDFATAVVNAIEKHSDQHTDGRAAVLLTLLIDLVSKGHDCSLRDAIRCVAIQAADLVAAPHKTQFVGLANAIIHEAAEQRNG